MVPREPAGQDPQPGDEVLVSAVLLASRALVGIAARSLNASPYEVTLAQYRALVVLASRGPQAPSGLATELAAAPSSITRLCDRLVRKGLIGRRPAEDSRRQVVLAISASGREVVEAVTTARRSEIARVVKAVPAPRRQAVIDALSELGAAAGETPDEAWMLGWDR
ncbi:MAG: MarR family transcriptional regulator [Actinomycetota bacterium]